MAISLVSSVSGAPGATPAINTTGANFLLQAVNTYLLSAYPIPTDSKSNIWKPGPMGRGSANGNITNAIWYAFPTPTVGSGHTFSASNGFPSKAVLALAGVTGIGVVGTQTSGPVSALQNDSFDATKSPGALVTVAYGEWVGTVSIDSGFTILEQRPFVSLTEYGLAIAWKLTTSGTEAPTWTFPDTKNNGCLMFMLYA